MGIDYQMSIWAGMFAPKGTPKEAIATLAAALDKALDDPGVKERLFKLGGSVPPKNERSPDFFSKQVQAEIAKWAPILKAAQAAAANK
jgi:tripartite-type tricarboxylate transporter receptor subunit TctC